MDRPFSTAQVAKHLTRASLAILVLAIIDGVSETSLEMTLSKFQTKPSIVHVPWF